MVRQINCISLPSIFQSKIEIKWTNNEIANNILYNIWNSVQILFDKKTYFVILTSFIENL